MCNLCTVRVWICVAVQLLIYISAMGKIINTFCRDLHTYGNYTFPVPEHVPTGECDYIWKTENKTVIGYGLKNLSLPSCLDSVHFVVRCDGGDKLVTAMEEIRNVSCSVICTDGSCTYQIPAGVRTGEHCDHAWMAADGMVLGYGRRNLILPDCRKVIHFVTRCDDTEVEHSVTYRAFNTTQGPITVDPSGSNTTMDPLGIWLPILMVLFLVGLCIGLFIMYRLKMFCFKRANGPNPADGNCDLRDAEDGISGASVPLNNNHTPPGPNCNGVKTDHKNGGENIPMVPISNGGSHSLNHDPPPPPPPPPV